MQLTLDPAKESITSCRGSNVDPKNVMMHLVGSHKKGPPILESP